MMRPVSIDGAPAPNVALGKRIGAAIVWVCSVAVWVVVSSCATPGPVARLRTDSHPPGLRVSGRHLYDADGNRVVPIGANVMTKYWDPGGWRSISALAQTGANTVRIFWKIEPSTGLDAFERNIRNAVEHGMFAMPSLWEATGQWSQLERCVDWWVQPEVLEIISRYERHLLLNIANEAGDASVSMRQFESGYRRAITRLREAGIRVPLVIDAANWGRDESYILQTATALIAHDPERNLLFSWHPWDDRMPRSRYTETIDAAVAQEIPLIIGEFSHTGVFYNSTHDWRFLVEYATEHDIGWLAWVWRGADVSDGHNITTNYLYGNWTPWGAQVVELIERYAVRGPGTSQGRTPESRP
ncbi:MAG: hypothetical protein EA382_12230 [Spirochaetaceae bacterium]|nr:MAG: hypothetical protein EA382_12230 [Spirochaetaceae bacterium]